MPKRVCPKRAEWRLVRGQQAHHLSAHYQLECDYGTGIVTIYQEGDAIYLCEEHASTVAASDRPSIAGVRLVETASELPSRPVANDHATPTPPISVASAPFSTPAFSAIATRESDGPPANRPATPHFAPAATTRPNGSQRPAATPPRARTRGEKVRAPVKPAVRDLTFGDCAKALVDEAIWNLEPGDYGAYRSALQQGKSAAEAAQLAGGQLAIVHRKIREYELRIEVLLSDSKSTISAADVIDRPLERETVAIIGSDGIGDAQKDAAIDHLGSLQEEIKRTLHEMISPLQAHRTAREIGNRANWGAKSSLQEELIRAYRALYTSLRGAAVTAVPEAQPLDERLANLYAAKFDLETEPVSKALHSVAN